LGEGFRERQKSSRVEILSGAKKVGEIIGKDIRFGAISSSIE
jgi:hypothetical protein